MSTLFISHSSHDSALATELERRLSRVGHTSVFLDLDPEKGIVAGDSWEQTLYRKLRACRAVVALCTDTYLASQWCFAEIALARMEGKPVFALKSDPLSASARLPSILNERQFIDLRDNPEQGYQRLWTGLSDLDLLGEVGDWNPRDAPYLGLDAYHEKHAPVFFGRDADARNGIELLERGAPGLIMTLGASGSGKSSLVRAGILPRLRRDPDRWLVLEPMRPGEDPFIALAECLVQSFGRYAAGQPTRIGQARPLAERLKCWSKPSNPNPEQPETLTRDERVQRLLQQLEELHRQPPQSAEGTFLNFLDWSLDDLRRICEDPGYVPGYAPGYASAQGVGLEATVLLGMVSELRRLAGREHARVLLVVDQFEELLSHESSEHPANDFLWMLRRSIEAAPCPLMVLGTMRSDVYGTLQRNLALRGLDFETFSVGPVTNQSLRQIIEAPARLGAITLEPGLVDRLIIDTETTDALPLLSFTLWVLWRDYRQDGVLTLAEYEALGGLHGAVAREADALLKGADVPVLRRALLHMARITEEGRYARRTVQWDEAELQAVHPILERFVERRLLVVRGEGVDRTVEVAHEALFRSWAPLRRWLDEDRSQMLLKQHIRRDAIIWTEQGQPGDNLWQGARLLQADELLRQGALDKQQSRFVRQGLKRRRLRQWALASTTVAVLLGMAGLTLAAVRAEREAVAATGVALSTQEKLSGVVIKLAQTKADLQKNYFDLFRALNQRPMMQTLLPDARLGRIVVDRERLGALAGQPESAQDGQILVSGTLGKGRVLAVAHDGLLSRMRPGSRFDGLQAPLVRNAIKWTSGFAIDDNTKVLLSAGHCEVVTLDNAAAGLQRYSLASIGDLSDLTALQQAQVLVIGNAWARFTPAERQSIEAYVRDGGGLILAGLFWSWNVYRAPEHRMNYCDRASESGGRQIAQDRYPMNDLGRQLGLQWVE